MIQSFPSAYSLTHNWYIYTYLQSVLEHAIWRASTFLSTTSKVHSGKSSWNSKHFCLGHNMQNILSSYSWNIHLFQSQYWNQQKIRMYKTPEWYCNETLTTENQLQKSEQTKWLCIMDNLYKTSLVHISMQDTLMQKIRIVLLNKVKLLSSS